MSYSSKELIEIIEKCSNKKDLSMDLSVDDFIKFYKLESGLVKVPNYVIYYYYCNFCKKYNRRPKKRMTFFKNFNKEFQRTRSGHQRYYLLNDKLNLTKDVYEQAKEHKKEIQKSQRKSKVSRTNKSN